MAVADESSIHDKGGRVYDKTGHSVRSDRPFINHLNCGLPHGGLSSIMKYTTKVVFILIPTALPYINFELESFKTPKRLFFRILSDVVRGLLQVGENGSKWPKSAKESKSCGGLRLRC